MGQDKYTVFHRKTVLSKDKIQIKMWKMKIPRRQICSQSSSWTNRDNLFQGEQQDRKLILK